jgi:hypothetical protein
MMKSTMKGEICVDEGEETKESCGQEHNGGAEGWGGIL